MYAVIGAAAGEAGEALWLSFMLAGVTAGLSKPGHNILGHRRLW
jgi:hypothetical protein